MNWDFFIVKLIFFYSRFEDSVKNRPKTLKNHANKQENLGRSDRFIDLTPALEARDLIYYYSIRFADKACQPSTNNKNIREWLKARLFHW